MPRKTQIRSDLGHATRTYAEVAAILAERYGWRITKVRVQQICARAESKLRRALEAEREG